MALAVKGYQAPAGARYNEQVEELQLLIGANADGVWGSESQRKWDAYVQRNRSEQSKRRMNTAIAFAINKGERRYMQNQQKKNANSRPRVVGGYTLPASMKTTQDVMDFQKDWGLTVDGIWGKNTDDMYRRTGGYPNGSIVAFRNIEEYGTRQYKQEQSTAARVVKGYQKPAEYQSVWQVKQFQRSRGLKDDGIWGPQTDAEYKRLTAPKTTRLSDLKRNDYEAMAKQKIEQSTPARALKGYRVPAEYNTLFKLKIFQYRHGLVQDGIWGPDCERAYQAEQQAARRAETDMRRKDREQAAAYKAQQEEQKRLQQMRQNGQTPQDTDPTIAGMRSYNQTNVSRGTQSRVTNTQKPTVPQDTDPATVAIRKPNQITGVKSTSKSKTTNTKNDTSKHKSPEDVNTDALRGFNNPNYQTQDDQWERVLPEKPASKEDVVSEDPNAIATEQRYEQSLSRYNKGNAIGWLFPLDDATLGEFNVGRDELQGRVPEGYTLIGR